MRISITMVDGANILGDCCVSRLTAGQKPPRPTQIVNGAGISIDKINSVDIPSGNAFLGTRDPIIAIDGEGPLRRRKVARFKIDPETVTVLRFAAFVKDTGYQTDAELMGNSLVFEGLLPKDAPPSQAVAAAPWWRQIDGACWHMPVGKVAQVLVSPDDPVQHISWNDATAFAHWVGGRLPTEVEWEHAARGGLGDVRYPWGDRDPDDKEFFPCNIWQGNFPRTNTAADGYIGPAPARSFKSNGYGLYNMVGNVWEWTSEPFKVRSLKKNVKREHAGKTGFKLSKGGSFLCHSSYCFRYRIAARSGTSPDTSTSHQGFRIAYDYI